MKRLVILVRMLTVMLMATLLIEPSSIQAQTEREVSAEHPYKIGIILALSGGLANIGTNARKGIEFAYSKQPKEVQEKIKLFFEDDSFEASKTVSAFNRLVTAEDIDAVLVMGSSPGNALAPLAERKGIPMIAMGASDFNVVKGRKFTFTHWVTPQVEAKALVAEMKRRKYSKFALVSAEQEGAIAVHDAIVAEIEANNLGKQIVLDEKYVPSLTDFRTYIAKAKSKEADVIISCLFPGAISSFAKQLRQLGSKADFVGVELFEDEAEVRASEGAMVGSWYVSADSAESDFVKSFTKKYGEAPAWGAPNTFDSLNILIDAALQLGRSGDKVADYLRTLKNYKGAAGHYSASGDNRFNLAAAVKVVKADGFEKLER